MFILALAALALGLSRAPAASADVCTGGAPYQGSGSPPSSLPAAVPFLKSPRWSKETLPQWAETRASGEWGDQLAYAWYQHSVLWDATSTAAWWVIPGQGCATGPHGEPYDPQDCILVYAQLALVSFDCLDQQKLAGANPPRTVKRGGQLLVSGFAPPGTGSVQVTDLPAVVPRPLAAVVLVDQTGLFSSSEGPLASTPRLKSVAARLHAHLPSVSATILGTAVTGHRAHDDVLYGPGAHALAAHVARTLHAPAPTSLGGGALSMFGSVARVVVLVGHSD